MRLPVVRAAIAAAAVGPAVPAARHCPAILGRHSRPYEVRRLGRGHSNPAFRTPPRRCAEVVAGRGWQLAWRCGEDGGRGKRDSLGNGRGKGTPLSGRGGGRATLDDG
jgi:hypothetical protein